MADGEIHTSHLKRDLAQAVCTGMGMAIASGAVTALLDFRLDITTDHTLYEDLRYVFPPLSATLVFFFAVYTGLWSIVAFPSTRIFGMASFPISLGLAVFLGLSYSVFIWRPVIDYTPALRYAIFGAVLVLFLSMIAGRIWPGFWRRRRWADALGLLFPFSLLGLAAGSWTQRYGSWTPLPQSISLLVGLIGGALVVLFIVFFFLGPILSARIFVPSFFVLIVLLPVASHTVMSIKVGWARHFAGGDRNVPRVILLTVDTLRADALNSRAEGGTETPNLDSLAADSVVFEAGYSSAPWTLPGFASMLTGLSPSVHRTSKFGHALPEEVKCLAEYLQDEGYLTVAHVLNPVLDGVRGFDRGFLRYEVFPRQNPGGDSLGRALIRLFLPFYYSYATSSEDITDLTLSWLEANRDDDFFLWHHFLDPHFPYAPPRRFWPEGDPPPGMGYKVGIEGEGIVAEEDSPWEVPLEGFDRQVAWYRELYLAEVRYMDEQVGRLLEWLKENGLYEDTLIVFTSDHGEEFAEHGELFHGRNLYEETLRVPFMIKLPGSGPTRHIAAPVSTESVTPTILELLGIEIDADLFSSTSLAPLARGLAEPDGRPLYFTGLLIHKEQEAILFNAKKLIRKTDPAGEELYDLEIDPGEQESLIESQPMHAEKGREFIASHRTRSDALGEALGIEGESTLTLKPSSLKQLEGLGYL